MIITSTKVAEEKGDRARQEAKHSLRVGDKEDEHTNMEIETNESIETCNKIRVEIEKYMEEDRRQAKMEEQTDPDIPQFPTEKLKPKPQSVQSTEKNG